MGREKYRGWPRLRWRCQDGAEVVGIVERERGVKGGGPDRIWGLVWGSGTGGSGRGSKNSS